MAAIKVHPDGSFTVSDPEDAIKLQSLILARQQREAQARPHLTPAPSGPVNGERPSAKFISLLKPVSGKEIDSHELTALLGLSSVVGLGVKIRHLTKAFEQDGLKLDDYLTSKAPVGGGPRVWTVK